ncbi:hypothetical protein B0A49_09193 [Cryomyces minteri]|uniref:Xylanolytic transcriptional activator regulatory domain-containing protein n=1 Tax=Cryomyces minteri TaxID=331657 RepID=A0A4U0WJ23_9PEZI|nr:hypothetical protein B0A49_09193 [Cryomyces minteri]
MDPSAPLSETPSTPRVDDGAKVKRTNKACLNYMAGATYMQEQDDGSTFHGLGNVGTYSNGPETSTEPSNGPLLSTFGIQLHRPRGPPNVYGSHQIDNGSSEMDNGDHEHGRSTETPAGGSSGSPVENMPFSNLQNPSDALGILAQIASNGEEENSNHRRAIATQQENLDPATTGMGSMPLFERSPSSLYRDLNYHLVSDGHLTVPTIRHLVRHYKDTYHPYFPLVPPATFDPSNLASVAEGEPHLLTAILVIASKDIVAEPQTYAACASYMQKLVSDLAAGGKGGVEAVEALLLLAEWTPYTQKGKAGQVGRGEEDREAWMHVGTALRVGYFLGLDRYAFRLVGETKDPQFSRKRLVWTACYISDRQISIRIGRAFWSRGPGPLTTLRKEDFPLLQPQTPGDEDYASIFQATLELTMLFSNVHDVLYSNPGSSFRSHLSGGYIKYIDDFRSAIYGWKSVWGTLTCAPHLKATLLMSYDYLRLYTNAFAFQATIRRALPTIVAQAGHGPNHQSPGRIFFNNVGAVGDARFIYEGLDAAKGLLTTVNNFVDPENMLRYMPLRFYIYTIYSGVFLYRARCVGVMSADEERSVRSMVKETVSRLQRSSVGTQHLGNRYSQLLELLWAKVDQTHSRKSQYRKQERESATTLQNPYRPVSTPATTGSGGLEEMTDTSPAITEQMGDFSWTDLDAVGNFAVNGNQGNDPDSLLQGFLPADMGAWDMGNFIAEDLGLNF